MNKTLCTRSLTVLGVALAVVLLGTVAVAQPPFPDTFYVNYYSNAQTAGLPDGGVWIDNPGNDHYLPLCAMIYVFDNYQEMSECCGCYESHNDLDYLSINTDLTSNPLTGVPLTSGVFKIVSSTVNALAPVLCDPTSNVTPTQDLTAWGTHIQNNGTTIAGAPFYPTTETSFSSPTLSAEELAALQAQCSFIYILGSGHGLCTCGSGSYAPKKKKK